MTARLADDFRAKLFRELGRPNVVARLVGGGNREYHRGADLAEGLQVGAVGHVIAKIITHGQPSEPSQMSKAAGFLDAPGEFAGPGLQLRRDVAGSA